MLSVHMEHTFQTNHTYPVDNLGSELTQTVLGGTSTNCDEVVWCVCVVCVCVWCVCMCVLWCLCVVVHIIVVHVDAIHTHTHSTHTQHRRPHQTYCVQGLPGRMSRDQCPLMLAGQ